PVHLARRIAAVAAGQPGNRAGVSPAPADDDRQLRAGIRAGLCCPDCRSHSRADRPLPEGWCGVTAIELRGVSRWYGNVVAVNDISMTVGPGVTGLLGPNGAGKTTILNMISGFLMPSRGEISVAGQSSWRNPAIFHQVGIVPERDSVYAFL